MKLRKTGLLLKCDEETFEDDKTGEPVTWYDTSVIADGSILNGTAVPELLDGLNGQRKAFEEGKFPNGLAVEFVAELVPADRGSRRFKVKFREVKAV